jgi:hypothetical protein
MKITIKKETTEEVEVSFPFVKKYGDMICLVQSETSTIVAHIGTTFTQIIHYNYVPSYLFNADSIDSTEVEFMEAYKNVQEIFKGILI